MTTKMILSQTRYEMRMNTGGLFLEVHMPDSVVALIQMHGQREAGGAGREGGPEGEEERS